MSSRAPSFTHLLSASREHLAGLDARIFAELGEPPRSGEPYGRALLSASDDAELLLMRWAPGVPCAPHDHGEATGFIRVLQGELVETVFRVEAASLKLTTERPLTEDEVVALPEHHVHRMCAHGEAVTLHLYRPKIRGMRVWDLPAGRVLVVDDRQGAFVPEDATRIVQDSPWPPKPRGSTGSQTT